MGIVQLHCSVAKVRAPQPVPFSSGSSVDDSSHQSLQLNIAQPTGHIWSQVSYRIPRDSLHPMTTWEERSNWDLDARRFTQGSLHCLLPIPSQVNSGGKRKCVLVLASTFQPHRVMAVSLLPGFSSLVPSSPFLSVPFLRTLRFFPPLYFWSSAHGSLIASRVSRPYTRGLGSEIVKYPAVQYVRDGGQDTNIGRQRRVGSPATLSHPRFQRIDCAAWMMLNFHRF